MKKYIFSALVLATSMVACTEDYTDWTNPQHNDQPAVVSFGNGSVAAVGLIDYADEAVSAAEFVQVCKITAPTASNAAYNKVACKINLGNAAYDVDAKGNMSVAELKKYVEDIYGKAPDVREIKATVDQWISNGKSSVRTAQSEAFNVNVKLLAPHISENYYVVGGSLDWEASAKSKAQKFEHSSKSVYDDPVFTITIPAAATGDTWFAIGDDEALEAIPGDWNKLFGTTGESTDLKGGLKTRAELGGDHSLCVPEGPKFLKITINMMDYTYSIEPISFQPYIYYVGTANGWNNTETGVSQKLALEDAATGTYGGYIYCKEESYGNTFKFLKEYGNWDTCYGQSDIETFNGPMEAFASDNNINATAGTGVYKVEFSVIKKTFTATKIDYMGVTGDFTGWNEGVEMTWNEAAFCYEATAAVTAAGWKFRANGKTDPDWKINFGGELNNLTVGGNNISVVGSKIKLYPCRTTNNNIYATVE